MAAPMPDFVTDMNAVLRHSTASWLNDTPPDYSKVNELYLKERTKIPEKGSIEDMITNIVKNWEKELAYKTNPADWVTIPPETFRMGVNGGPLSGVPVLAALGAYNAFIGDTEYYCASKVKDPNLSNTIFRETLCTGFAWEVLEVYSKMPVVAFKWRHWGRMDGDLKCPMRSGVEINAKSHGQRVELFGVTTVTLNDKFQMIEVEHFYRPDHLMEQLVAGSTVVQ